MVRRLDALPAAQLRRSGARDAHSRIAGHFPLVADHAARRRLGAAGDNDSASNGPGRRRASHHSARRRLVAAVDNRSADDWPGRRRAADCHSPTAT